MTVQSGVVALTLIEEEFEAELRALCVDTAPSRFAICAIRGECEDGIVVGWGMAMPDRAVVCHAHTGSMGRFRSAETAHRLFARCGPVRLVWIDPEPTSITDDTDDTDDDSGDESDEDAVGQVQPLS